MDCFLDINPVLIFINYETNVDINLSGKKCPPPLLIIMLILNDLKYISIICMLDFTSQQVFYIEYETNMKINLFFE